MKKIFSFFIIILCLACSEKRKEVNQNLIYFNSDFLAELGDENYDKYEAGLTSKIKPKYIDNIIYISKTIDANACGNYSGDLEIKKDSIILLYKLTSDEVCTSTSVVKVTYIIKNPKEKKYKFGLRYE
ncbi:hypothetical protein NAT51_14960 [Flavobacterium amniphilum]|uniref:hypothetical protein n=1 Tax=Flavobacterium amniphilum TaxID=1834035 RepID=UPI00202A3832|nr:hypothetical protein [Flavobacterium amniphilum]MCL9806833.1 hypothetical protein [Flavobacterium amniphilum]